MIFFDTHTHIYLDDFDADRDAMIRRALDAGVSYLALPHIDSRTSLAMHELAAQYPGICLPMMGLHPTSVREDAEEELALVEKALKEQRYFAIGEVGIDLYWDTSFQKQQEEAFVRQIHLALDYDLPLVIHTRNSIECTIEIVQTYACKQLRGIFHCFSGNEQQAEQVAGLGFLSGIGGSVSYKNSGMARVAQALPLEYIVLETDAPFLTPVPYRGKRNEPAYIPLIAQKIAELKNLSLDEIARQTTLNALNLFGIPDPSIESTNP